MVEAAWYQTPGHADGWRDVRAPGGYEWWYFDAQDDAADVQVVGIFLDGFVFHPEYVRRYGAYLRHPTKVTPPQAREYPCAYFAVYENGRIAAQFMTQFKPGTFLASADQPTVDVGPNRMNVVNGAYEVEMAGVPWKLTGRGPQVLRGSVLSARLTYAPITKHPPVERTFLSREMTGAEHGWVLAAPHCSVSGEIVLTGTQERTWTIRGRGYHDHNFGTAPLGPGVARWMWGRALFEDAAYVFHIAEPRNQGLPVERHVLACRDTGILPVPGEIAVQKRVPRREHRTGWGLSYPREMEVSDSIRISNPRVVDSSPFYLRAMYDAVCEGRRGRAFCEVAYPHRLRWPVLGRMVGMSITPG